VGRLCSGAAVAAAAALGDASRVLPLLLTGPPAVGKSMTANALAKSRPRAAFIDVDDIRQLVVSGHAAPWDGEEGQLQQRVAVENACDLTRRLHSVGIDVVLADVVNAATISIYRRRLPGLVIVKLRLPLAAARHRAASRPVHLTDQEFEDLYAAGEATDLAIDALVDVEQLAPDEQAGAVMRVWTSRSDDAS
jgi:predicted kinase